MSDIEKLAMIGGFIAIGWFIYLVGIGFMDMVGKFIERIKK